MTITVVGLGPGDGRFLTREAWQVLAEAGRSICARSATRLWLTCRPRWL
jgi:precorrin-2 methylase